MIKLSYRPLLAAVAICVVGFALLALNYDKAGITSVWIGISGLVLCVLG